MKDCAKENTMNPVAVGDIGTFSTKVLLGKEKGGELSLIGVGKSRSKGVKKGQIVNPKKAGESLKEAVQRAREMAKEEINSIYLGAGGKPVDFRTREATISITSEEGIIQPADINRLEELAGSTRVERGRRIVAQIPRNFTLDGQEGVTNPLGLQGRRLDMKATLVTVDEKSLRSRRQTTAGAGLQLEGVLPTPVCLGDLLLTPEEGRRGKIVLDLGAATVDLIVLKEKKITDHRTLFLGGDKLTGDLAAKFNISSEEARSIKHKIDLSEAIPQRGKAGPSLDESSSGKKPGTREALPPLTARIEETFDLILSEIHDRGHDDLLPHGIKLVGGGSRISGLTNFLTDRFEWPFERGSPARTIEGIEDVVRDPSYAPALSLLSYKIREELEQRKKPAQPKRRSAPLFTRLLEGIKETFKLERGS